MRVAQDAAQIALLKRVQLFSSLSGAEFAFLTSHLVQQNYSAGEIVFSKDTPAWGCMSCNRGIYAFSRVRRADANWYRET